MTNHTPKAFLRGRNQTKRPPSTFLNLLNAKMKDEAEARRASWDHFINISGGVGRNGKKMSNPVVKFPQLHPTRGYFMEWF